MKIHILIFIILLFSLIILFRKYSSSSYYEYFYNSKSDNKINNSPKIAFCFLCYGQPYNINIWKDFFNNNNDKYSVYLHPKYLSKVSDPFFKSKIIKNRIPTEWGDISLVQATINLFKEAFLDDNNKKFILLSETCLPLYNFNYIYNKILENNITYIHHLPWDTNKMKKERYSKLLNQEQIDFKYFRKQSQWLIFSRDDYTFLINHIKHINDYKNMFAPDEQFFINLFTQYKRQFINQMTTYVDWSNKTTPMEFNKLDNQLIDIGRVSGSLFIRKIKQNASINIDYLFSL
jgi:hypothetical protein